MNRGIAHMSLVVDDVLKQASDATELRTKEASALRIAETMPKTSMARGFRALADNLRAPSDDVSYDDIVGAL